MTEAAPQSASGEDEALSRRGAADPAPAAEPIESAGEALARARLAAGLSLDDIAQQLKFAPRQLDALEQGRLEELPGATYVRGMVRSYARLLKLDAGPLVERIVAQLPVPDAGLLAARFNQPVPFADASKRVNLLYVAFSVVILAVVGAFAFEWYYEQSGAAKLTFVPAGRLPAATVASAVSPSLAVIETQSGARPGVDPATEREAIAPVKRRIVLRFEKAAWVEIRDGEGRTLFSQLNPGGSERVVEGEPPFSLVVGNAHHVRLTYDDREVDLIPHVKIEVARFTLD
jgi:cytoskeleton protein RodZ